MRGVPTCPSRSWKSGVPAFAGGRRALRSQRPREGRRVVPHHVEMGRRRTVRAGQSAGIERAADGGPGLVCDLLEEARIGDVLGEDGRDTLVTDALDRPGDILCRRLGLGQTVQSSPVSPSEVHL